MRPSSLFAVLLPAALAVAAPSAAQSPARPGDALERQRAQAARVTITRDTWGVPHVVGRTDADAVFGLVYAQAEDDFPRVERNYIDALGRRAEVDGERALWRDLRARLFVDPADLRAKYAASPAWLRRLMDALGGRAELLPGHPPDRAPEPDHALRAVDGAELHRGQHRRRHRVGGPGPLASFYAPRTPGTPPAAAPAAGGAGDAPPPSRAQRLNGSRSRPADTATGQRAPAHQPAHLVLLPPRGARGERRGAARRTAP
jgi:acyl-homoserine-lactone acylase